MKENAGEFKTELVDREAQLQELIKAKEVELTQHFKQLEKVVNDLSKKLVKQTSEYDHHFEAIVAETANLKQLTLQSTELGQTLLAKDQEITTEASELSRLKSAHESLIDLISTLQSQSLGISVSDSDQEKSKGSLSAQLMENERMVTASESAIKQEEMSISHLKEQVKQKEKELKSAELECKGPKQDFDKKCFEVSSLKLKISQLDFNPEEFHKMENLQIQLQTELQTVTDKIGVLKSETGSIMKFDFHKVPGFDAHRVKGLVAALFQIKNPKYSTALEVAAGGKLFNVIVDNQDTGKYLLEEGKLVKRITILPLNKISSTVISSGIIERAKDMVGDDQADLALSLIESDPILEPAMKFVFGNTFVCTDSHSAKQIAFNKAIKQRTVTLEGDLFDPAGTLSGGSASSQQSLLSKLAELTTLQAKESSLKLKLGELNKRFAVLQKSFSQHEELAEKVEIVSHELSLIQTRLDGSNFSAIQTQVKSMNEQIKASLASIDKLKLKVNESKAKCKELEQKMQECSSSRVNQSENLEKQIAKAKKDSIETGKILKDKQQAQNKLKLERESLDQENRSLLEQSEQSKTTLKELQLKEATLLARLNELKEEHGEASMKLNAEKERLNSTDGAISNIKKKCDQLSKKLSQCGLDIKKAETRIVRIDDEVKEKKTKLASYLKHHTWIESEKQYFGAPRSAYDFGSTDVKKLQSHLSALKEQQEKLGKKINKKAIAMYDKTEQDYKELIKKRDIISRDKIKIEHVIEELDHKKNESLKSTWTKVNKDFSSIFSTLLPNTSAKLEASFNVENPNILEGLEVCVAFGAVWKESLTELSGGQRSLLALSLILALLLFKPAPMYILDEIDSALDLSHTQNIGQMIKHYFSQSQFIVVSLKEGMFNNANVLFRTKFVDGLSVVTRSTALIASKSKENTQGNTPAFAAKNKRASVAAH